MGQEDQAKEEIRIGRYFLKSAASVGSSPREVLRFITVRLFMNGRYKEAVFYAAKLLKTSYKDVQMHALVAEAYRNLGDLEKARNHFLRALEIDRESPEIRYGLLGVLWSLGRTEEVLAQARRLLQARPDDPMGLYFQSLALSRGDGDLEQTIKALQAQIRLTGPDPALMTALGGAYLKAGLAELAEGWYVRTLTVSPADTEALRSLADLYTSRGPREKALEALKRYLETDPEDAARRRALLRLLLEDEAFGEAADQIARLLTGEPRSAKLRAMLALCYRRSGKYSDALILLKDLLRKDPGSEELMKAVVYCLDKMGARPLAMQVLGDFMKRHGEKGGLLLMLGVLHFQDGKLEKSAETFRRAISLSPRDWKAHRNLGMVYRKMGNTEFAEAFLARAEEYRVKSADPG
jgi:Flp pilus assembly protein TadD